jgi:hypothetical protein
MTEAAPSAQASWHTLSISDADARLADWVASLLSDVPVTFEPPTGAPEGRGVSLYLFEVRPQAAARTRTPPLQAMLRYLVTTWAPTQQEAHGLLGDLLLAAMADSDIEVDSEPVSLDVWPMFSTAPKPSFVLHLAVRRERNVAPVRMVRQRLVVQTASLKAVEGTIVGPGDVPMAGARVEIPLSNQATVTDRRGRFSFPAVAAGPYGTTLRILARNRELTFTTEAHDEEPLVIRFEPLEG